MSNESIERNYIIIDTFSKTMFGSIDGLPKKDAEGFVDTSSIKQFFRNIDLYKYIVGEKGMGKSALYDYIYNNLPYPEVIVFSLPIELYINTDDYINLAPTRSYLSVSILVQILWGIYQDLFDNERLFIVKRLEENKIYIDGINERIQNKNQYRFDLGLKPVVSLGMTKEQTDIPNERLFNNLFLQIMEIICSFSKNFNKHIMIIIDGIDNFIDQMSKENYAFSEEDFLSDIFSMVGKINRTAKSCIDCKLFIRKDLFNTKFFSSNSDKEKHAILYLMWTKNEIIELIAKRLLLCDEIKKAYIKLRGKEKKKWFSHTENVQFYENDYKEAIRIFLPQNLHLNPRSKKEIPFDEWITIKFADTNNTLNPRVIVAFLSQLGDKQWVTYNEMKKTTIDGNQNSFPLFYDYVFFNAYEATKEYEYDRITATLLPSEKNIVNSILEISSHGEVNINKLKSVCPDCSAEIIRKLSRVGFLKKCKSEKYIISSILADYKPI